MRLSIPLFAIAFASLISCPAFAQSTEEPPLYFAPNRVAPSFEAVRVDIDQKLDCASRFSPTKRPVEPTEAAPVSVCPAYFPAVLESAGVEGNCISMFDLSDAGVPVNIETRCDVGARGVPKLAQSWVEVARRAFVYAAERALSNTSYQPIADTPPEVRRQNLSRRAQFRFTQLAFRFEPLNEFQRPPPAPLLESKPPSITTNPN